MNKDEAINSIWRAAELAPLTLHGHAHWQNALNIIRKIIEDLEKELKTLKEAADKKPETAPDTDTDKKPDAV